MYNHGEQNLKLCYIHSIHTHQMLLTLSHLYIVLLLVWYHSHDNNQEEVYVEATKGNCRTNSHWGSLMMLHCYLSSLIFNCQQSIANIHFTFFNLRLYIAADNWDKKRWERDIGKIEFLVNNKICYRPTIMSDTFSRLNFVEARTFPPNMVFLKFKFNKILQ